MRSKYVAFRMGDCTRKSDRHWLSTCPHTHEGMPGALGIDSVRGMARKAGPTDEGYESAAHLGLLGLMADQDADSIHRAAEDLLIHSYCPVRSGDERHSHLGLPSTQRNGRSRSPNR